MKEKKKFNYKKFKDAIKTAISIWIVFGICFFCSGIVGGLLVYLLFDFNYLMPWFFNILNPFGRFMFYVFISFLGGLLFTMFIGLMLFVIYNSGKIIYKEDKNENKNENTKNFNFK